MNTAVFVCVLLCLLFCLSMLRQYYDLDVQCNVGKRLSAPQRCGSAPADHERFVTQRLCPCNVNTLLHGATVVPGCSCKLPEPWTDVSCAPVEGKTAVPSETFAVTVTKVLVTNSLLGIYPGLIDGSAYPTSEAAVTMSGYRRLNNLQWLLEDAILNKIPGDFLEAGIWRGGMCILAAAVFKSFNQENRTVFGVDSFGGIPKVDVQRYPVDKHHLKAHKISTLNQNSEGAVLRSLERLGLGETSTPRVKLLRGIFKPTLRKAADAGLFARGFSVIRLDGDTYQSTWETLEILYPLVTPGGYIIIDDFYDWEGANRATRDWREKYQVRTPLVPVYHNISRKEKVHGAWFRKP